MSTTGLIMTVTDELLAELEEAASKATPQHLDSAEDVIRADSGAMIECPVCGGEGYASLENEYCNFDNHAIGVQFYGIGPEFGAAEEYYRRANPSTITALTAELRRLRAENAELERQNGLLTTAVSDVWKLKEGKIKSACLSQAGDATNWQAEEISRLNVENAELGSLLFEAGKTIHKLQAEQPTPLRIARYLDAMRAKIDAAMADQ